MYGIWPDEPAQLAIARFVGQGTRWTMHNHSTWKPGYGTLLAPVYLFTDDPTTVLRMGLTINALLGGVAFVLLTVVARRLTPMSLAQSCASALVVSLAPGTLFTTTFVWSESLVVVLYLATLLCLVALWTRPGFWIGVACSLCSVGAFATHSRMLPLLIITFGVSCVLTIRRRLERWQGACVVATTLAGFFAVTLYSQYIVSRVWNEPIEGNSYSGVAEQLTKVGSTGVSAAGQVWYLLATWAASPASDSSTSPVDRGTANRNHVLTATRSASSSSL